MIALTFGQNIKKEDKLVRQILKAMRWIYPATWFKEMSPKRLDYRFARWIWVGFLDMGEASLETEARTSRVCVFFWKRLVGALLILVVATFVIPLIVILEWVAMLLVISVRWFFGFYSDVSLNNVWLNAVESFPYKTGERNGRRYRKRFAPWELATIVAFVGGIAVGVWQIGFVHPDIGLTVLKGGAGMMLGVLALLILILLERTPLVRLFPNLGGLLYALYDKACPRNTWRQ